MHTKERIEDPFLHPVLRERLILENIEQAESIESMISNMSIPMVVIESEVWATNQFEELDAFNRSTVV